MRLFIIIAELIGLLAITVWLVAQPGSITIDLGGYTYQADLYVAFLAMALLFVVVTIVLKIWHFIVLFPARMYAYTQRMRPEKGMRALLQGVIATALEEFDQARAEAYRVERFLGENGVQKGLLVLNDMHQARWESARAICETMKADNDSRTLSWIFEARMALDEGKEAQALTPLQQLYQLHENSPWVLRELLKTAYNLGMYDLASEVLKKAERTDLLDQKKIKQARALVNYEQSKAAHLDEFQRENYLEQANRLAPGIVTIALDYSKVLRLMEKTKRARKVLEAAWSIQPDFRLLEEYTLLDHETDPKAIMKAVNRLVSYNEKHLDSYIAIAKFSIKMQEWGRARAALNDYREKHAETQEYFYLMARLELSEHGDHSRYREWMEQAIQLPKTEAHELVVRDII